MNNILLVFDSLAHPAGIAKKIHSLGKAKGIILCPLTNNQEKIDQIKDVLQHQGLRRLQELPVARLFNDTAFAIKKDFIGYISDFANLPIFKGKNIKEYFKYPGKEFSAWWFSSVAEKNTFRSDSFFNLARLIGILDICKTYQCTKLIIDVQDMALSSSLKKNSRKFSQSYEDLNKRKRDFLLLTLPLFLFFRALMHLTKVMAKAMYIAFKLRKLHLRKDKLKSSKFVLVTYFPAVDKNALKKNKFSDSYYGPLGDFFHSRFKNQYTWLAVTFGSPDFNLRESITLGRNINEWGENLYFLDEWIGPVDFIRILGVYFYLAFKFVGGLSLIKENFVFKKYNLDIWDIFKVDFYYSFIGSLLPNSLFRYRAFKNFFVYLEKGTRVFYIAEMHFWEKALNSALKEVGDLSSVGIQHTIVSLLSLMYFNSKDELEGSDYVRNVPIPDYLGCVGKIPLDIFKDMGWDEKRVFILGGLRFASFKTHLDNIVPWKDRKDNIVVALPMKIEEAKELLLFVHQAFRDVKRYTIIIKGHPTSSIDMICRYLGLEFAKAPFVKASLSLDELLPQAKALVVTESSATLYALSCHCAVIVPRCSSFIDLNPLSGISDLQVYAYSPQQLRNTVDGIIDSPQAPLSPSRCKDFLGNYCTFCDSQEELAERMAHIL